jgi:peptidoglycan hydrolase-like protein with peptidoglycan-binding domain
VTLRFYRQSSGLRGPKTQVGVVGAQRRAGLVADGVVGPMTRRALRLRGLGVRTLRQGSAGADVVALQFSLAWRGFPSGSSMAASGRAKHAVRRFQRPVGLTGDGIAGPSRRGSRSKRSGPRWNIESCRGV